VLHARVCESVAPYFFTSFTSFTGFTSFTRQSISMSGAHACERRRSLRGEGIRERRGSLWRLERYSLFTGFTDFTIFTRQSIRRSLRGERIREGSNFFLFRRCSLRGLKTKPSAALSCQSSRDESSYRLLARLTRGL
jgi:hypothetical protein